MTDADLSPTAPRVHPSWVLAAIVIVFAAYGVSLSWYADDHSPEWLGPVLAGGWVFQAHMFAIWAALGPGKFLLRLPLVAAAFFIVLGAPGVHPDGLYERREFLALFLTGTIIFAIATLLLLVVCRFTGLRVVHQRTRRAASRYQFNLRYPIIVITLYAVALGIYTNIVFKPPEPPTFFNIFGPDFLIRVIVFGGATVASLVFPMIAVPLLSLSSRRPNRAIYIALLCWAIMTGAFSTFWQVAEGEGMEFFLLSLLAQVGAVSMGVLAALPLRLAGYRLEGRQAVEPPGISN